MSLFLKQIVSAPVFRTGLFLGALVCQALVLWILAPGICLGDLYTWTDHQGIKHFSNISPPATGKSTRVREFPLNLPKGFSCRVIKVYDGDTIRVKAGDIQFKVRLSGIDAPELEKKEKPAQPFAKEAKQVLTGLVYSKQVILKQHGTGSYNRVLAEVFSGGININLEMLKKGMAEVYQGRRPDWLQIPRFQNAQAMAKKKKIGIWSLGKAYQSPKNWRKK